MPFFFLIGTQKYRYFHFVMLNSRGIFFPYLYFNSDRNMYSSFLFIYFFSLFLFRRPPVLNNKAII